MKRFEIIICFLFISIFLFWIEHTTLYASVIEDKRLSFDFTDCDISEALSQITKVSGIKIIVNGTINKKIADKSYKNMRLDHILSDLLRGQNCAIVWHYNELGLSSINIRNFGQSDIVSSPVVTASRGRVEPGIAVPSAVKSISNVQSSNVVRVSNTGRSSGLQNNLSNSNRSGTVRDNVGSNIMSDNQAAIKGQTRSVSSRRSLVHRNTGFTSDTINEDNSNTKDENNSANQISPIPEKWHYLEAPPMPPGVSSIK
jgi:hypothetical protein